MKSTPEIITFLTSLGLSEKEGAIYLAALELGETLQLPLSQKAGIRRTTMLEYLPSLLDRGLLQQTVKGQRTYYVAQDPRKLVETLKTIVEQSDGILPVLLAMQNSLAEKPVVRFFTGIEGIKQVYETITETRQPTYSFMEVPSMHPALVKWVAEEHVPKRIKLRIPTYNIVNSGQGIHQVIPESETRWNLLVPAEEFPFKMEVLSCGDYVAFIHYRHNDEPSAVLIQSQAAATTIRSVHQLVWKAYYK